MLAVPVAILGFVTAQPAEVTSTAHEAGIELTWTAPAAPVCPDAAAIVADSIRALGPSPPNEPLWARATVVTDADGFALELIIDGAHGRVGTRQLRGKTCPVLARVAALVIAVAIDPDATMPTEDEPADEPTPTVPEPEASTRPTPTPLTPPTARPVKRTVTVAPRRREPMPPQSRPWIGVLADAGVGAIALPALAGVVGAAISMGGRRWRAELGAVGWTASEQESSSNPAVGGRFGLLAGRVRGCYVAHVAPLELPMCAGGEFGAVLARGTGKLTPRRRPSALVVAATLGPQLWWRPARLRGRLGLFVRADLLLVAVQPRFGTARSGVVWKVPSTAVEATGGIEVRFGRSR